MTLALLLPCYRLNYRFAKSSITVSIAHSKYNILRHTIIYPMHFVVTCMIVSSNHVAAC